MESLHVYTMGLRTKERSRFLFFALLDFLFVAAETMTGNVNGRKKKEKHPFLASSSSSFLTSVAICFSRDVRVHSKAVVMSAESGHLVK